MKIAVLVSTYNGERYLEKQIQTLLEQDIEGAEIIVRDDGSTDNTRCILQKYEKNGLLKVQYGSNIGYKKSFMKLLLDQKDYDYYAFCDQDDVWLPDKLSKAISKIQEYDKNIPIVYYSNLKKCDENLNIYGETHLEKRVLSLESNILRRSIAGCTMVMNNRFHDIVTKIDMEENLLVQGHDSYLISLCYAIRGKVICDKYSYILYRQHGNNTSGSSNGVMQRIKKEINFIKKNRSNEYILAKALLNKRNDFFDESEVIVLEKFIEANKSFIKRINIFFSRDYRTGNIILTSLGKLKILLGIL